MKVLILSTYEKTGGAAIAAQRLMYALRKSGVDATMLCRKNISWWPGKPQSWTSIFERGVIWLCNGFSMKRLWLTDIALFGQDITKSKEYKEADVIHLHWVNQGFLSLKTIDKICKSGKRVVWTMHDAWNAIGAYHWKFQQQNDSLERKVWTKKEKLYFGKKIQFVTCSEWLKNETLSSNLMKGQNIVSIPNPINSDIFKPQPHENKRRVLFVAQDVNNPRKGVLYLNEAEKIINKNESDRIEIVALGRDIPYINNIEEMAKLYASFDAFVIPSLSENLPNTIMEAMACGTPCVGFAVGGIPEMIDHKVNGYVAKYKDSHDLAAGISYVLSAENHARLATAAREKVLNCYSEESVAKRYIEVYVK